MAIIVKKEACKGCRLCIKSCPFSAITLDDQKKAVIGMACTECGTCVEKCPFHAIEKTTAEKEKADISAYHGVWVFAEQRGGKLMPVVIELLGEGRKLAQQIGTELCAVLLGENVADLARECIGYGADKVYVADAPELKDYTTDAYTKVIYEAIQQYKPEIVLCGATHIGRDLGPCLSVKCETGLTADCTKLEIDPVDHKIMQTRPAFGGNLMATIVCPEHRPQMSTVRPGVMEKAAFDPDRTGEIVTLKPVFADGDLRVKVLEIVKNLENAVSLTDAKVIVAGGMGLGSKELRKPLAQQREQLLLAPREGIAVRALLLRKQALRRLPRLRGRGLGAAQLAGGPDRHHRQAGYLHRLRHLGRDSACGRHEGFRLHRRDQQEPVRRDLRAGRLWHRGRPL